MGSSQIPARGTLPPPPSRVTTQFSKHRHTHNIGVISSDLRPGCSELTHMSSQLPPTLCTPIHTSQRRRSGNRERRGISSATVFLSWLQAVHLPLTLWPSSHAMAYYGQQFSAARRVLPSLCLSCQLNLWPPSIRQHALPRTVLLVSHC
ncbi:uncharacterized protein B0H18DRAFT_438819 [Fomitopsis serialis]|uniref:uncharacterized protein n=1 Tax=Fomitopsis serialis TaxID=139415 RepID=UPI00200859D7|nr:uncharacterized protein B0H18DRAFT_438819 [Neoantrodia serialis]KAH9924203.1 hypothetical protein B0H18DRAFT_438819 [Neoantrodia serialis]